MVVRSKDRNIPIAKNILDKAEKQKIKVLVPKNKEISYKDDDITIFSYFVENGDDNETSIVNLLQTDKHKLLFTGDASAKSLQSLKKDINFNNTDVLKVPHHGGKGTLSKDLLSVLRPKISVISTGYNIYGHPSKETLTLLKQSRTFTLRTDKDNAIKVVFHKNKILVYSYNMRRKKFERIKNDWEFG